MLMVVVVAFPLTTADSGAAAANVSENRSWLITRISSPMCCSMGACGGGTLCRWFSVTAGEPASGYRSLASQLLTFLVFTGGEHLGARSNTVLHKCAGTRGRPPGSLPKPIGGLLPTSVRSNRLYLKERRRRCTGPTSALTFPTRAGIASFSLDIADPADWFGYGSRVQCSYRARSIGVP